MSTIRVGVGSKNKTKVGAVETTLRKYPLFKGADVIGVAVQIEEFGHPKNITETVEGAIARAKQAQQDLDYGIGIEGGLMEVPYTKSGFMEVAVCAIFDGTHVHIGLSPACEWPKVVLDKILYEGLDGSQAMKAAGLTTAEKLGEQGGMISLLTKRRMDRTMFNASAIEMALIHLENPELY